MLSKALKSKIFIYNPFSWIEENIRYEPHSSLPFADKGTPDIRHLQGHKFYKKFAVNTIENHYKDTDEILPVQFLTYLFDWH